MIRRNAEAEAPADDWETEAAAEEESAAAAASKKDKKKRDKKSKGAAAAAEDAEDIDAILGTSSAAAASSAADGNDDEAGGDDDELAKAMASGQALTKAQQKRLRKKQASADPTQVCNIDHAFRIDLEPKNPSLSVAVCFRCGLSSFL